jgi:GNAT superfamily N-acetyltransferase
MIRRAEESDYEKVAVLYCSFFKVHTMFQRASDIVEAYVRKENLERELWVYDDSSVITGALVLVNTGVNEDGSHKRWKFRHLAFERENVGAALLTFFESRVSKESDTVKIELTIAASEQWMNFYQRRGYVIEGQLSHHYRWGEMCFVLGKSFSS